MESALKRGCTIKIDKFEGPLDLLYQLIEKNQMSIYDIRINEIADQYMDYLFSMQKMDLEIASEFLVMAATLLHIKSRLLLPQIKKELPENEIDPEEELILKLIQYKKFKEFAQILKNKELEWARVFYKQQEEIKFKWDDMLLDLDPDKLRNAFVHLLDRNVKKTNTFITNKMTTIIEHEKVSLRSKIRDVLKALITNTKVFFSDIFSIQNKSKLEIVTGFMAVLELAKIKKLEIEQEIPFGEITLIRKGKAKDLDDNSTG